MNDQRLLIFKRFVFRVCIGVAALHIVFCCYFVFFQKGPLSTSAVGAFYKSRFIVGPFFMAERLKISPHLLVSHKVQGEGWSAFQDDAMDNFKLYQAQPWRYNALAQADFVRYLCRKMRKNQIADSVWKTNEFKALNTYVVREVLPPAKIDSVRLAYVLRTYDPGSDVVKSDTSWTLTYTLHDQPAR